jgi:DNA-binding LacI/PurR family transcriptional regulator
MFALRGRIVYLRGRSVSRKRFDHPRPTRGGRTTDDGVAMAKIDEVARAAGVSISTVSYALSGKRPVAAETKRRIDDAVRELDYRPNAGARMLAGRRAQIFALTEPLRSDTYAPTHMAFVLAASVAARRRDYDILLLTDEEASAGMRRVASSGLVDAVLVLDVAPDDERVRLAREIDTPVVFIGVPDDATGLMCVDLDFHAAAALAVDRLADEEHRRLGLVGQPPAAYALSNFPPRVRDGFHAAAARRAVATEFRMPEGPGSAVEQARRAAMEMLESGASALVLHCGEDAQAAILEEISRRGWSVPRDVSVVSVGSTFDPGVLPVPLSSVPLVPEQSCDLAVDLAAQAVVDGRYEPGVHLVPPVFVDRGSTAPISRAGASLRAAITDPELP